MARPRVIAGQLESLVAFKWRIPLNYLLIAPPQSFAHPQDITMDGMLGYFVHESSYVDDEVEIGKDTCIWHFSHVLSGSKIGESCRIGQNVVIGPRVQVGDGVKIQNNVSVYEGVTLEDSVFCGPSVVFTNINTPRSAFPRNRSEDNLITLVKHGASLGANATIICGNTIGEHALVGAGSVVTKDVKPYAVVYGNPAKQHGWACECGIVLAFQGKFAKCQECSREYVATDGDFIQLVTLPAQSPAA